MNGRNHSNCPCLLNEFGSRVCRPDHLARSILPPGCRLFHSKLGFDVTISGNSKGLVDVRCLIWCPARLRVVTRVLAAVAGRRGAAGRRSGGDHVLSGWWVAPKQPGQALGLPLMPDLGSRGPECKGGASKYFWPRFSVKNILGCPCIWGSDRYNFGATHHPRTRRNHVKMTTVGALLR